MKERPSPHLQERETCQYHEGSTSEQPLSLHEMSSNVSERMKRLENRVAALEESLNVRGPTYMPKIPPPLMSAQTNGKRKRWVDVAETLRLEIDVYNEGRREEDHLLQFEKQDNKAVNTLAKRYLGNILQEALPEFYGRKTWDQVQRSHPKRTQRVVRTAAGMYEFRVFAQAEGNWAIRILLDEKMKSAKDTADAKRKRENMKLLTRADDERANASHRTALQTVDHRNDDGIESRTNSEDEEDAESVGVEQDGDKDISFATRNLEAGEDDRFISQRRKMRETRNSDDAESCSSGESEISDDDEESIPPADRNIFDALEDISDDQRHAEPTSRTRKRFSNSQRKTNISCASNEGTQSARVHQNVQNPIRSLAAPTDTRPTAQIQLRKKGNGNQSDRRLGIRKPEAKKSRVTKQRAKLQTQNRASQVPRANTKLTQRAATNSRRKKNAGKEPVNVPRKLGPSAPNHNDGGSRVTTNIPQEKPLQRARKTQAQRVSAPKSSDISKGRQYPQRSTRETVRVRSPRPGSNENVAVSRLPIRRASKKSTERTK